MTLLRRAGMMPGSVSIVRDQGAMEAVFELILRRQGRPTEASRELCRYHLGALLWMAAEKAPLRCGLTRLMGCYRRAVTIIDGEYASLRSVSDLAGRLGVTPEHLSRTFKEMGGGVTIP